MHASPKFGINLFQFRLPPLPHRSPKYRELPPPVPPTDMRKTEEVEGLRLSLSPPFSVGHRKSTKLDQAGLVGMKFQSKLGPPRPKLRTEGKSSSFRTIINFQP